MKLLMSQETGTTPPLTSGGGKEAEVLYYDGDASLLWFIPDQRREWNFLYVQSDNGAQESFGEFANGKACRCGNLCYQKIHDEHRTYMERVALQLKPVKQAPNEFPLIAADLSSVVNDTKYHDAWLMVAKFASLHLNADGDLTTFLQRKKWREVVEDREKVIERDAGLFRALESRLRETKFLIAVGGRNSGVSRFVKQFTTFSGPAGVEAEFWPNDYSELRKIFEPASKQSPGFDLAVQAIFASLAFSAYKNLREYLGPNASKTDKFLDLDGSIKADDFAYAYLNKARRVPPIDLLLLTVDKLATSSRIRGGPPKVLMFLPFARLGDYFWEKSHKDEPERREERLGVWDALREFATRNLDHLGRPREKSTLWKVKNASLLVELGRIELPLLPDNFCRACIIQVPPLSEKEVKNLWRQRTRTDISARAFEQLTKLAGGHPYLIDALVTIASELGASSTHEAAQLSAVNSAADQLRDALRYRGVGVMNSDQPQEIRLQLELWVRYVDSLRDELPQSTLSNDGPLSQLLSPKKEIKPTIEHSDWLASGFAPLKSDEHVPLGGFAKYPEITSTEFPALVVDIIRELRSPSKV